MEIGEETKGTTRMINLAEKQYIEKGEIVIQNIKILGEIIFV